MDVVLKILFVEDVKTDAELIWNEIEKNNIAFKKLLVDNGKAYLESLASFGPDIIISDYYLPRFDGMSALLLRNEHAPLTPFILVTGSVNEEIAVECMKAGADDYVLKENLSRLGPAILNAIKESNLIKDKKEAEDKIHNERILLRTLIDNIPDTIYVKDLNCRKIIANRADLEVIGVESEAEVLGKTDPELFPGDIGERGFSDDLEVLKSEKAILRIEEDFVDKKGVRRWLLTSKLPYKDDAGKVALLNENLMKWP
jgi:PAS domain S-box-containing protein